MNAETIYLVRRSDAEERGYRLYELTWLWRTAQLPGDAEFRNARGEWRPLTELVEPVLSKPPPGPPPPRGVSALPRIHRWFWAAAAGVVLVVAAVLWPQGHRGYQAWKDARIAERTERERQRQLRTQDFVRSNDLVPGMIPEDVRRIIGPPRAVQATGDATLERWIYRHQIVVFENGKVIGVEANR